MRYRAFLWLAMLSIGATPAAAIAINEDRLFAGGDVAPIFPIVSLRIGGHDLRLSSIVREGTEANCLRMREL